MRLADDGTLPLSPSDLSAHLACPHLTRLDAPGRARRDRKRRTLDSPHRDLIFRKGNEHEAAYLARLETRGALDRAHPDLRRRGLRRRRGAAADRGRRSAAREADVIYQPYLADGPLARVRGLPRAPAGRRYEAVDTKLARTREAGARAPALLLRRAGRADPGTRPRARARRDRRAASARPSASPSSPPTTGACASGSSPRSTQATADVPVAVRPLRDLRLPAGLPRSSGCDDDHLTLVAGMRRTQVETLLAHGIPTLEALGELAAGRCRRRHPAERRSRRSATRPSSSSAVAATRRAPSGSSCPTRRSAASALLPEPDARRRLARPRGRPVLRAGARARVPVRLLLPRRRRARSLRRALGARPRRASGARSSAFVDWVVERRLRHPGMHVYHYAAYERTALHAADGRARHARGRGRRPPAPARCSSTSTASSARRSARRSPSYSIKEIETLYGFERTAEVAGGDESVVALRAVARDAATTRSSRTIERYNEEDCRSTCRAARLAARRSGRAGLPWRRPAGAARAERGGARGRDAERASAAGDAARRQRDRGEPRLAARAPARLPPARGAAAVVGVLPLAAARRRRARRRPRRDRRARAGTGGRRQVEARSPCTADRSRRRSTSSAREAVRPATRQAVPARRVDDDAGVAHAAARRRKRRTSRCRAALDARAAVSTTASSATRCCGSPARTRPATSGYPALAARPRAAAAATRGSTSTRVDGRARARRELPVRPGAARLGQDVARARGMAIALMRAGKRVGVTSLSHKAIHNLLRAVAARGRPRRATRSAARKKAATRTDETAFESRCDRRQLGRHATSAPTRRRSSSPARRGRSRGSASTSMRPSSRSTSSSSTRPASSRSPTCSRSARRRARSSCSATRTSCRRSRRARTRRAPGARCSSTCSATTRRCRRTAGSSSRRRGGCGPSSARSRPDAYYEGRLGHARGRRAAVASHVGNGPAVDPGRARAGTASRRPRRPSAIAAAIDELLGTPFTDEHGVTRPLDRATSSSSRRTTRRCGCCAPRLPTRRRGRHGRQVPGAAGAGRLLLDGELDERGRAARDRVPVRPATASTSRRRAPSAARAGLRARAPRRRLRDGRADAPRQRRLPVRRAGRAPRPSVDVRRARPRADSPACGRFLRASSSDADDMLVPWPVRSEPSPSFPASRRSPAACDDGPRSHHRPRTRWSTSRRRGRASKPTRSSRSRFCGSMPTGVSSTASRASCGRPARSPPRRPPCTGSTTRRSAALRRSPSSRLSFARCSKEPSSSRTTRLRPPARAARLRAGRRPLPPHRRRMHARRVSAARAHGAEPPARVTLRAARNRARRRARRPRRRARHGRTAPAPAEEGIAPETVELDDRAYMRARSRGDTRPASDPQIRRVFGSARPRPLGPDGGVDRDAVAALVRDHADRRRRRADARAGAGRLRRARTDQLRSSRRSLRPSA